MLIILVYVTIGVLIIGLLIASPFMLYNEFTTPKQKRYVRK